MAEGSSLGAKDYEKKSKLARARGVGASKGAAKEWLTTRILSVFALLSIIYVLAFLLCGVGTSYEKMHRWVSNPFNATILIIAITTGSWHAILGLITIVKDYIHNKGLNLLSILLIKGFFWLITIFSIVSVLYSAFK